MMRFLKAARDRRVDTDMMRYLIVGLGNPGIRYAKTRHNIGFRCVERLASAHGIDVRRQRFESLLGEGEVQGKRVVLLEPQTFMNDSGRAVAPASRWYKIPPERVLVAHDDLDLPLGRLRLRPGGSSGGHKGIESIIQVLGTNEFPRLRLGIGRPEHGDPIDYVLARFTEGEEQAVGAICDLMLEITRCFMEQGIEAAMNAYNGTVVEIR